jgi:hypothetical protein
MRRRQSPYSCIEEMRRSRSEVLTLIVITVVLGLLLGLLTEGLADGLRASLTPQGWRLITWLAGLLSLLLTLVVAWLLHGYTESRRVRIDLWLPYHFPGRGRATVARNGGYRPPRHARRAFMRRYRAGSEACDAYLEAYAQAQGEGQPFQAFITDDHRQLTQCLALYVLHYYGDKSLGPESRRDWSAVAMEPREVAMDELPPPLRDNPFLRADQRPDEWRLLLPEPVAFHATSRTWRLRHRRHGEVIVRWLPRLTTAGRNRRPYKALTADMELGKGSELYVIGARIEAVARLRWILLPASEPFHRWATGLLARLEENLDFQYYITTQPDRVIRDLGWKIGWVPEGSSIVEMLQTIEGRLDDLEMDAARAALEEAEDQGDSLVV